MVRIKHVLNNDNNDNIIIMDAYLSTISLDNVYTRNLQYAFGEIDWMINAIRIANIH